MEKESCEGEKNRTQTACVVNYHANHSPTPALENVSLFPVNCIRFYYLLNLLLFSFVFSVIKCLCLPLYHSLRRCQIQGLFRNIFERRGCKNSLQMKDWKRDMCVQSWISHTSFSSKCSHHKVGFTFLKDNTYNRRLCTYAKWQWIFVNTNLLNTSKWEYHKTFRKRELGTESQSIFTEWSDTNHISIVLFTTLWLLNCMVSQQTGERFSYFYTFS